MSFNWFKYTTIAVVCLFCGILVFVVYKANTRGFSGRTHVDAATIQAMRLEADENFRLQRQRNP